MLHIVKDEKEPSDAQKAEMYDKAIAMAQRAKAEGRALYVWMDEGDQSANHMCGMGVAACAEIITILGSTSPQALNLALAYFAENGLMKKSSPREEKSSKLH